MKKIATLFVWLSWLNIAFATDYFVKNGGNDTAAGTSDATAWASLSKINALELQPGDRVFLKSGSIWNGQLLLKAAGTSANPVIVDSYGGSDKPIINGQGTPNYSATVTILHSSFIEVNNLEVTNNNPATARTLRHSGMMIWGGGLFETGTTPSVKEHIYIKNCYIHDVDGVLETGGLVGKAFGGISLMGYNYDLTYFQNNADNLDATKQTNHVKMVDVLIEGNTLKDISSVGSRTWGGGYEKIYFRGNSFENVTGDVIVLASANSANPELRGVIEHNVANIFDQQPGNQAAFWNIATNNAIIQYNEAYNGRGFGDGEGLDIDLQCNNTTIQYNYTHHNKGGFMLHMRSDANSVVRYNISYNDGPEEIFHLSHGKYYNNTFYTTLNDMPIFSSGSQSGTFQNNIFVSLGQNTKFAGTNVGGVSFSHNLYYMPNILDKQNLPFDPAGIYGVSPQFTNAGGLGVGRNTCSGLTLSPSSVLLKPENFGVLFANNGGKDFFENAVSTSLPSPMGALVSGGGTGILAPELKTAEPVSASEIKLSWTAIPGATSYRVLYIMDNSSGDRSVTTVNTNSSATNFTVRGLNTQQKYFFVVKGITAGGTSIASNSLNATTPSALDKSILTTADSHGRGGTYGNVNYDGSYIAVKFSVNNSYIRKGFLKFDISQLADKETDNAVLRLTIKDLASISANSTLQLFEAGNTTWDETTVTYNSLSPVGSPIGSKAVSGVRVDDVLEFDIKNYIDQKLAAGEHAVAFVLAFTTAVDNSYLNFYDKENNTLKAAHIVYTPSAVRINNLEATNDTYYAPVSSTPDPAVLIVSPGKQTVLRYDVSSLLATSATSASEAKVKLKITNISVGSELPSFSIYQTDRYNWSEGELDYNQIVAVGSAIDTKAILSADQEFLELDVTGYINGPEILGGAKNNFVSFIIQSNTAGAETTFASKDTPGGVSPALNVATASNGNFSYATIDDTYLVFPNGNYNKEVFSIKWDSNTPENSLEAIIQFDISQFVIDKSGINNAKLVLNIESMTGVPQGQIELFETPTNWEESTVRYGDAPDIGGALASLKVQNIDGTQLAFDVTDLIKAKIAEGTNQRVSFALRLGAAAMNSNSHRWWVFTGGKAKSVGAHAPTQLNFHSSETSVEGMAPLLVIDKIMHLSVNEDAKINYGSYANTNYSGSTLVVKKSHDPSYTRASLVKFDLSKLRTLGVTALDSANIKLSVIGVGGNSSSAIPSSSVSLFETDVDTWHETTVTANGVTASGTSIDSQPLELQGTEMVFNITAYLTNILQNTTKNVVSFILVMNDNTNESSVTFESKESNSSKAPILEYIPLDAAPVLKNGVIVGPAASPVSGNVQFTVYPNPTTDNVYLNLGKSYPEATVYIYNVNGSLLFSKKYSFTQNFSLTVPENPGTYIVKVVTNEGGVQVQKIVKQ